MDVPLIDHYLAHLEIRELLGIGGAAEVYRAWDPTLGHEVAVKVLSQRAEPDLILRFVREGRALADIEHPCIVDVYHIGERGGPALHRDGTARRGQPQGTLAA